MTIRYTRQHGFEFESFELGGFRQHLSHGSFAEQNQFHGAARLRSIWVRHCLDCFIPPRALSLSTANIGSFNVDYCVGGRNLCIP